MITDYNLDFLLLFNPLFVGFLSVTSVLKNLKKSVSNFVIVDAG